MTYADMITLLLCFFAIFLAVSIPKKDVTQKVQVAQTTVLPARPTDFLEGNLPFHGLERADQAMQDTVPEVPARAIEPPAQVTQPPAMEVVATAKASAPPTEISEAPRQTTLVTSLVSPPAFLEDLKLQGTAEIEQKGDRITTLEMSSAAFFDSGSATLSKAGEAILREIAIKLGSDELRDYLVTVEGHTDDAPINTARFPSNWELSTARASAVVHFFLDQGISARKLRAAGYADTFPKAPNRDANGIAIPANQAQNRRVIIKLEKIDKADRSMDTVQGAVSYAPMLASSGRPLP